LQISASVPKICKFEKYKYANEVTDVVIHSTQYNPQVGRLIVRTTGDTPMAIKIIYRLYFPMATHSFPVPLT